MKYAPWAMEDVMQLQKGTMDIASEGRILGPERSKDSIVRTMAFSEKPDFGLVTG
jgi:hypothetical protein